MVQKWLSFLDRIHHLRNGRWKVLRTDGPKIVKILLHCSPKIRQALQHWIQMIVKVLQRYSPISKGPQRYDPKAQKIHLDIESQMG